MPAIAAIRGAQIPAAFTTISVSIDPASVRTPVMAPRADRSNPVTRTPVRMRTPRARAASATACVAPWGSRCPSPARWTAPKRSFGDAAGIRTRASAGPMTPASSPIPRARLAVRSSSCNCSVDDASRRLPTVSKTPSCRYSSMLYRRNAIIVLDGLNAVTRPAA